MSVSSNDPNKNELPSLVKSNNLVIPLLIHSNTALPAGTFRINKAKIPTHVEIEKKKYKLDKDSVILLEQIRTLDKKRLKEKLTYLSDDKMKEVDNALMISLGLNAVAHQKN